GRAGAEPGQTAEVAGAEIEIECGGRGRGQSREARGRGGQTRTGGHGVAGADDDPLIASGQGADMIEEVRDACGLPGLGRTAGAALGAGGRVVVVGSWARVSERLPAAGRIRSSSALPQYLTSAMFGWARAVVVLMSV